MDQGSTVTDAPMSTRNVSGSVTGASTVEMRIAARPSDALPRYISIHMKLITAMGMLYSTTMPVMMPGSEKMIPAAKRANAGMSTTVTERMARSSRGRRNVSTT